MREWRTSSRQPARAYREEIPPAARRGCARVRPADPANFPKDRRYFGLPAPPIVAGQFRQLFVDALLEFRHPVPAPIDPGRTHAFETRRPRATSVPPRPLGSTITPQYSGPNALWRVWLITTLGSPRKPRIRAACPGRDGRRRCPDHGPRAPASRGRRFHPAEWV